MFRRLATAVFSVALLAWPVSASQTAKTLRLMVGQPFEVSLPELTGCSRGFVLMENGFGGGAASPVEFAMVGKENTLTGIPTPDDVGPHVAYLHCARQRLIDETVSEMVETSNGVAHEIIVTVMRPVWESVVASVYMNVVGKPETTVPTGLKPGIEPLQPGVEPLQP